MKKLLLSIALLAACHAVAPAPPPAPVPPVVAVPGPPAEWLHLIEVLGKECPPPASINFVFVESDWFNGMTSQDEGTCEFTIQLNQQLNLGELMDTTIHEWAHTLSFGEEVSHGDQWALAYGRCYRASIQLRKGPPVPWHIFGL